MQPGGHRFDPGQLHQELGAGLLPEPKVEKLNFNLMLGVNLKQVDAEHWVGGTPELVQLWSEQNPYPPWRVSWRKSARTIFDN